MSIMYKCMYSKSAVTFIFTEMLEMTVHPPILYLSCDVCDDANAAE